MCLLGSFLGVGTLEEEGVERRRDQTQADESDDGPV